MYKERIWLRVCIGIVFKLNLLTPETWITVKFENLSALAKTIDSLNWPQMSYKQLFDM